MGARRNNKEISNKVVMVYRKSTNEEGKQENSIQMQRQNAVNFCQLNGLIIVAEVEERDSGTLPLSASTGLLSALELAATHGASFIGFDKFDRAARNLPRYFHFKSLAAEVGAKVLILSEGMPTDDGKFSSISEIMQGFLAEHTVKMLRERVKQGMKVKRDRGEKYCRNAAIGFKWTTDGKIERDEKEASAVEVMKDLSNKGFSTVKICKELAAMGYKNRNGTDYKPMSVWRVIQKAENV